MAITYKDAGVDIDKGDALVEKIKEKVKSTYGSRVKSGVGGFACLYEVGDRLLAAGTDGVGTKLKLAQELDIHNTIGIDLVAMCVNDILCTGAKSLFFMDYLATGKLDVHVSEGIIDGVVEGCRQCDSALIGGETAEMPGMYTNGEYDLAGFAVGEVFPKDVLDGSDIKEGATLIGLVSTGFHSNGYSLVRKLIKEDDSLEFKKELLTPTKIYEPIVRPLLDQKLVSGLAHVTGGGFLNIARLNSTVDYLIDDIGFLENLPSSMKEIISRSGLGHDELFKTFNMGIGLVLITDQPEGVQSLLSENGHGFHVLGKVTAGSGQVVYKV
jgi:phosphoribosylformylglycinamidine cyclo-ligase